LALLQRELRFKALALIDLGQALVLAISMIGLAVAGFRYWTLVCGGVLGALISTGAVLRLRHPPLAWPRLHSLKHATTLSSNVLISRLCWYASANADFLVAGRILGKAALGFYNVGWTLASVSVDKITALVGQVTPAFFSAVQRDTPAMRRYLLRITEGIALITFPVSVGLALVARDFVLAVLGSKWEATIAPLQILAAYAAVRSITPLLPQVLHTIRDTKVEMWTMVAAAVVMPTSFYFSGQRWGTVGLAMAWVLMDPLITTILYWRVFSKIDLSPRAYLRALWPAVSGTAVMAAVVLAVGVLSGSAWTAAVSAQVEWWPRLWTLGDGYRRLRRLIFGDTVGLSRNVSRVTTPGWPRGLLRRLGNEVATILDFPDEGHGWILRAALRARSVIRRFQPEIVVSSGPPHSAHLVAGLATLGSATRWLID